MQILQITLLAYQYEELNSYVTLLALGSHENFYRDLKRSVVIHIARSYEYLAGEQTTTRSRLSLDPTLTPDDPAQSLYNVTRLLIIIPVRHKYISSG